MVLELLVENLLATERTYRTLRQAEVYCPEMLAVLKSRIDTLVTQIKEIENA